MEKKFKKTGKVSRYLETYIIIIESQSVEVEKVLRQISRYRNSMTLSNSFRYFIGNQTYKKIPTFKCKKDSQTGNNIKQSINTKRITKAKIH